MYTSLLIATVLLPNIFRGGTNSAPIDKPPTNVKRISLGHLVAVSGDGRSQNQISYRHVENLDRIPAILMHPNPVPLWYAMVDGPFTHEYPTFTLPDALEVERNRAYSKDDFNNDDFDDEFKEQRSVVTNSDDPTADNTGLIEQSQRGISETATDDSSKTNRSKLTISESDLVEDLPRIIHETPQISEDERGIDLVENLPNKIGSTSVEETPQRSEDNRGIDLGEDTEHKIDSTPVEETPKKSEDDRGIDLVENVPHKIDSANVEEIPNKPKDNREIDLVQDIDHKTNKSAKETSIADNRKKSDTSMDNPNEKNTQSPKCSDNISRQTFHNPEDSKSFLICNDGNLFKMNCPSTLVFNSELKLCDWPTP